MADKKYGTYRSRDENGKLVVKRYDAEGNDKDAKSEPAKSEPAKGDKK